MAIKLSSRRLSDRLDLWLYLASLTALPLFASLVVIFSDVFFRFQLLSLGILNDANVWLANLQLQVVYYLMVIIAGGIVAGLTARIMTRHHGLFDQRVESNFTPLAVIVYLAYGWFMYSLYTSPSLYLDASIMTIVSSMSFVGLGFVLPLAYRLALKTLDRRPKKR